MLKWLSKQFTGTAGKAQTPAQQLYYGLLAASRTPALYLKYGARDDFDGRFDVLCLVMAIMLHRLRDSDKNANSDSQNSAKLFSQDLFDAMFADMDATLREQGAGDTAVGKRIRIMSEGFSGRLAAYSSALDEIDPDGLADAIARNVSRSESVSETDTALAALVIRLAASLSDRDYHHLVSGAFEAAGWVEAQC